MANVMMRCPCCAQWDAILNLLSYEEWYTMEPDEYVCGECLRFLHTFKLLWKQW